MWQVKQMSFPSASTMKKYTIIFEIIPSQMHNSSSHMTNNCFLIVII